MLVDSNFYIFCCIIILAICIHGYIVMHYKNRELEIKHIPYEPDLSVLDFETMSILTNTFSNAYGRLPEALQKELIAFHGSLLKTSLEEHVGATIGVLTIPDNVLRKIIVKMMIEMIGDTSPDIIDLIILYGRTVGKLQGVTLEDFSTDIDYSIDLHNPELLISMAMLISESFDILGNRTTTAMINVKD